MALSRHGNWRGRTSTESCEGKNAVQAGNTGRTDPQVRLYVVTPILVNPNNPADNNNTNKDMLDTRFEIEKEFPFNFKHGEPAKLDTKAWKAYSHDQPVLAISFDSVRLTVFTFTFNVETLRVSKCLHSRPCGGYVVYDHPKALGAKVCQSLTQTGRHQPLLWRL